MFFYILCPINYICPMIMKNLGKMLLLFLAANLLLSACKKDIQPIAYFTKTRATKKYTVYLKIRSDADEQGWIYSVNWGDNTDSMVFTGGHLKTISHTYSILPCLSCYSYNLDKDYTIQLRVVNKDKKTAIYSDTLNYTRPDTFSPNYTFMTYQIGSNTYNMSPSVIYDDSGTQPIISLRDYTIFGNIYSIYLSNIPAQVGTYTNHSSSGPNIQINDDTGSNYSYITSGSSSTYGSISISYFSTDSISGAFSGRIGNYAGYWDVSNGKFTVRY